MVKTASAIVLVFLFMCVSCSKKEDGCSYDPCNRKAPDAETQVIEAYLSANNLTAVKHCSGLYYQIEDPGTGASPSVCSAISITYSGRLINGNLFDQSATPVVFNLMQLIEGWKAGLPLLKKGGHIKLYVPPSLGYGAAAYGNIPGNSVCIFDIRLVDVY
jgi:FKBP-type peptidyl-prolyl cis-trans isomerase FkpA